MVLHRMGSDGMVLHRMARTAPVAWDGTGGIEWHGIASGGMRWYRMAWFASDGITWDGTSGIEWHGIASVALDAIGWMGWHRMAWIAWHCIG